MPLPHPIKHLWESTLCMFMIGSSLKLCAASESTARFAINFAYLHSFSRPPPPLPPVGHIWDTMLVWRMGNINRMSLCYNIVCHYNGTSSSYRRQTVSGFDLASFSSVSSKHLCILSLYGAIYILKIVLIHSLLYLLVGWVWLDWPLIWLTNHCLSSSEEAGTSSSGSWHDGNTPCQESGHMHDWVESCCHRDSWMFVLPCRRIRLF